MKNIDPNDPFFNDATLIHRHKRRCRQQKHNWKRFYTGYFDKHEPWSITVCEKCGHSDELS